MNKGKKIHSSGVGITLNNNECRSGQSRSHVIRPLHLQYRADHAHEHDIDEKRVNLKYRLQNLCIKKLKQWVIKGALPGPLSMIGTCRTAC